MAASRTGLLRALRHRNYRLFFGGQSVSLVGTWITRIATGWLVYRLTGSAFMLGVVGFCGQIPTLFLAPVAGVFVDRWDRQRVLLVTQVLSLVQSVALGVLTLLGIITVAEVLVLQVAQGIINAFDTPARQAFVVTMVEDRADLPNAIALNSSMVNGSRIVGPSIGGIIIAAVGEGWCFMLDAVSYVAVIASLLAMRIEPEPRERSRERAGRGIPGRLPLRHALPAGPDAAAPPGPREHHGHAVHGADAGDGHPGAARRRHTPSGFSWGPPASARWPAALYLASRHTVVGLGRAIAVAVIVFGAGLIAFGTSRRLLALARSSCRSSAAAFMLALAATNTIVQTIVEEHLRGRVMAFYAMAILGTAPIGSLLAGLLASRIGVPATIQLGGAACVAGGIAFTFRLPRLRELVRPIYVRQGIIAVPAVDAGT